MTSLRIMQPAPAASGDNPPDVRERIQRFCASASFEVAAKDFAGLQAASGFMPPGSAVSITWLPNETNATRIAAAVAIRKAGFEPVPHVAARRLESVEALDRLLQGLRDEAGATQALLIAGDIDHAHGPFPSSLQVLQSGAFERAGFTNVGFGGHPEGHPSVDRAMLDSEMDAKIARASQGGMASFVVTQFCFASEPILAWTQAFRQRHPTVPVRIGLAGPASLKTLMRFAALCGVGTSAKAIIGRGASLARLLTESGPDPVIKDLATSAAFETLGPIGLHLFPFGGLARTAEWNAKVVAGRFQLRPAESGFQIDK